MATVTSQGLGNEASGGVTTANITHSTQGRSNYTPTVNVAILIQKGRLQKSYPTTTALTTEGPFNFSPDLINGRYISNYVNFTLRFTMRKIHI